MSFKNFALDLNKAYFHRFTNWVLKSIDNNKKAFGSNTSEGLFLFLPLTSIQAAFQILAPLYSG
jgi:hypothetical protein